MYPHNGRNCKSSNSNHSERGHSMYEILSIHERRRRAPLHFLAKADNARFIAYLLAEELSFDCVSDAKAAVNYGGDPRMAMFEAFRREAAIALELIIKAVIAQRIESRITPPHIVRVEPTYDVPKLWQEAKLPKVSNEDRRRLVKIKEILLWSGRYAAPRNDKQGALLDAEDEALRPRARGQLFIREPLLLDWGNFDRLYQIANSKSWEMRRALED
jgi:hypothetical protein